MTDEAREPRTGWSDEAVKAAVEAAYKAGSQVSPEDAAKPVPSFYWRGSQGDRIFEEGVEFGMRSMAEQREASVKGQVGLHFRQTVNVRVNKPRWMPDWAYRRLMRTIVVEESWPTILPSEAGLASEGFSGHKPLPGGKCEHRWRNRQTKIVTCRFADGWHAGRVALAIEYEGRGLDVDRLALALLSDRLARVARVNGGWEWWAAGPDAFAEQIAAIYDRLSESAPPVAPLGETDR